MILKTVINYYHSALGDCGREGQSMWTVYNQNGNIDTLGNCNLTMGTITCTECAYVYRQVTGLSEYHFENSMSIYPNQVQDILSITLNDFQKQVSI